MITFYDIEKQIDANIEKISTLLQASTMLKARVEYLEELIEPKLSTFFNIKAYQKNFREYNMLLQKWDVLIKEIELLQDNNKMLLELMKEKA